MEKTVIEELKQKAESLASELDELKTTHIHETEMLQQKNNKLHREKE